MRRTLHVLAGAALLLAVAAPAHAGGGGCREPDTTGATTTVSMQANCFGPTVTRVAVGDTVHFVNDDGWNHTVTAPSWGSARSIGPGDALDATFDQPGVYPYVCLLHPAMIGAVVVGDAALDGAVEPTAADRPQTELRRAKTPAAWPVSPGTDVLAAEAAPASPTAAEAAGVSWAFALGLALLGAVVGTAVGAWAPRRRVTGDR